MICLYLKIQGNFIRLILEDEFWFMCIPFANMVKFWFLRQFPVDHLPYSYVFCANLLLWFTLFLHLSPHNSHLLFCCILSIFALTQLVILTLFGAARRKDSVSLFKSFPFLAMSRFSHIEFYQFVSASSSSSFSSSSYNNNNNNNNNNIVLNIVILGGVRGVIVTVQGNGHGDPSSKPERGCLHFHIALIG